MNFWLPVSPSDCIPKYLSHLTSSPPNTCLPLTSRLPYCVSPNLSPLLPVSPTTCLPYCVSPTTCPPYHLSHLPPGSLTACLSYCLSNLPSVSLTPCLSYCLSHLPSVSLTPYLSYRRSLLLPVAGQYVVWEPLYITFSIHPSHTARSSALREVSGGDAPLLKGELFWNQRGRRILCLACYEQPLATRTTLDWICFAARWISLRPVGPDQGIHPAQSPVSSRLFPTRPLVPGRPWTQGRAAEPGSMMGDG